MLILCSKLEIFFFFFQGQLQEQEPSIAFTSLMRDEVVTSAKQITIKQLKEEKAHI